jgi:hypothetical protein
MLVANPEKHPNKSWRRSSMAEVRHAGELFLLCEYSESGMVASVIRCGH